MSSAIIKVVRPKSAYRKKLADALRALRPMHRFVKENLPYPWIIAQGAVRTVPFAALGYVAGKRGRRRRTQHYSRAASTLKAWERGRRMYRDMIWRSRLARVVLHPLFTLLAPSASVAIGARIGARKEKYALKPSRKWAKRILAIEIGRTKGKILPLLRDPAYRRRIAQELRWLRHEKRWVLNKRGKIISALTPPAAFVSGVALGALTTKTKKYAAPFTKEINTIRGLGINLRLAQKKIIPRGFKIALASAVPLYIAGAVVGRKIRRKKHA